MKEIVIDTSKMLHSISTKGAFDLASIAVTPSGGLWFERPMVGHQDYAYLEALLVPHMGIQVCRYTRHVGEDWFDWYIDIVEASRDDAVWVATDLCADVLLREGQAYRVVDLDELVQAVSSGQMSPEQCNHALRSLQHLCNHLNNSAFTLSWLWGQLPERRSPGAALGM